MTNDKTLVLLWVGRKVAVQRFQHVAARCGWPIFPSQFGVSHGAAAVCCLDLATALSWNRERERLVAHTWVNKRNYVNIR
jgi:hypothetical protein